MGTLKPSENNQLVARLSKKAFTASLVGPICIIIFIVWAKSLIPNPQNAGLGGFAILGPLLTCYLIYLISAIIAVVYVFKGRNIARKHGIKSRFLNWITIIAFVEILIPVLGYIYGFISG